MRNILKKSNNFLDNISDIYLNQKIKYNKIVNQICLISKYY